MHINNIGKNAVLMASLFGTPGATVEGQTTLFTSTTIAGTPTFNTSVGPIPLSSIEPPSLENGTLVEQPSKARLVARRHNFPDPDKFSDPTKIMCYAGFAALFDQYRIYGRDWDKALLHGQKPNRQYNGEGLHKELKGCSLFSFHFEMLSDGPLGFEWLAEGKTGVGQTHCIENAMRSAGAPPFKGCYDNGDVQESTRLEWKTAKAKEKAEEKAEEAAKAAAKYAELAGGD